MLWFSDCAVLSMVMSMLSRLPAVPAWICSFLFIISILALPVLCGLSWLASFSFLDSWLGCFLFLIEAGASSMGIGMVKVPVLMNFLVGWPRLKFLM